VPRADVFAVDGTLRRPAGPRGTASRALPPEAFKSTTGNACVAHGHRGIPMTEKILENAKIGPAVG
jgi:hypothetical protein